MILLYRSIRRTTLPGSDGDFGRILRDQQNALLQHVTVRAGAIPAFLPDGFLLALDLLHHAVVKHRSAFAINHLLRRCLPYVAMVGVLVCGQPHRGHQQAAGQRDTLQYQRNAGTLQLAFRLSMKRSHDTASSDVPASMGGLFELLEHNAYTIAQLMSRCSYLKKRTGLRHVLGLISEWG